MNDELLVKFLLDETSPEENQTIKGWLDEDKSNRKKMEHFKIIWESSNKQVALHQPVDADLAWDRFKLLRDASEQQAQQQAEQPIPLKKRQQLSLGWLKIAASVIISVGAMLGIYNYVIAPKHPYFSTLEFVSTDEPVFRTLPDGSSITLNKHSRVSYTERLFDKQRAVKMSGEVFFDVKSIPSKPFEVAVNDVAVKVLGTSFNIKSNAEKTEVIVETGAVQMSRNNIVIKLKPDEQAIARMDELGFDRKKQTDHLYDYYRSKVFKLDGTPLWRFVEVLNEVYQTRIVIENTTIANLPVSTTFENDSLTTILNTICQTLRLRTEKSGGIITIKK